MRLFWRVRGECIELLFAYANIIRINILPQPFRVFLPDWQLNHFINAFFNGAAFILLYSDIK
jgi:hypothetical protein